jgi:hypothetical protein
VSATLYRRPPKPVVAVLHEPSSNTATGLCRSVSIPVPSIERSLDSPIVWTRATEEMLSSLNAIMRMLRDPGRYAAASK